METWVWFVIAAIIVGMVALGVIVLLTAQQRERRTEDLREGFGPEYDRAVDRYGSRKDAEAALEARRERVEKLRLREIPREQRQRLLSSWTDAQARFVDEPASTIDDAERLIDEAMKARGYPAGNDFDQRYDDLSVEYGNVLDNYRDARRITVARREGRDVSTEDLRRAMVCYRTLFNELVNADARPPAMPEAPKRQQPRPRGA